MTIEYQQPLLTLCYSVGLDLAYYQAKRIESLRFVVGVNPRGMYTSGNTLIMLRIFVEVLNPFEAQFVVRLSIVANSDSSGCQDTSVISGRQVKLTVKDDEQRDCLSSYINCLDRSNLLPVPRLFCPQPTLPI